VGADRQFHEHAPHKPDASPDKGGNRADAKHSPAGATQASSSLASGRSRGVGPR
jgi:hypothetical protein